MGGPAFRAILICAMASALQPALAQTIDRIDAIGAVLDLCVTRALKGQGFTKRRDVTLRLSFRRDGTIISAPMVTYSSPRRDESEQARFIDAVGGAFRACTPLPFSKELGGAIAGKIFTFRYTLTDAKDQSI
jgi:hypothetical protein